ncbi:unnamed protein product [Choristocarpus tenellus]
MSLWLPLPLQSTNDPASTGEVPTVPTIATTLGTQGTGLCASVGLSSLAGGIGAGMRSPKMIEAAQQLQSFSHGMMASATDNTSASANLNVGPVAGSLPEMILTPLSYRMTGQGIGTGLPDDRASMIGIRTSLSETTPGAGGGASLHGATHGACIVLPGSEGTINNGVNNHDSNLDWDEGGAQLVWDFAENAAQQDRIQVQEGQKSQDAAMNQLLLQEYHQQLQLQQGLQLDPNAIGIYYMGNAPPLNPFISNISMGLQAASSGLVAPPTTELPGLINCTAQGGSTQWTYNQPEFQQHRSTLQSQQEQGELSHTANTHTKGLDMLGSPFMGLGGSPSLCPLQMGKDTESLNLGGEGCLLNSNDQGTPSQMSTASENSSQATIISPTTSTIIGAFNVDEDAARAGSVDVTLACDPYFDDSPSLDDSLSSSMFSFPGTGAEAAAAFCRSQSVSSMQHDPSLEGMCASIASSHNCSGGRDVSTGQQIVDMACLLDVDGLASDPYF